MSDLSPRAKALIDYARARSNPTEADAQRIAAALDAKIAAGATPKMEDAPRASLLSSPALKIVGAAIVVGLVGLGAYRVSAPRAESPVLRAASSVAPPAPSARETSETGEARETREALEIPTVDIASLPSAPAQLAPSRAIPSRAPAAPVAEARSDLGAELALVREAQRALAAGTPARALTLLDEHARRFPQGALAEERAAAHVLALCDLHREREARVEAAAFLREHPQSPQVPTLGRSCARGEK